MKEEKRKTRKDGKKSEEIPDEYINKGKEELQYTLELVNSWVQNCDQKAGMLLAVIGVAITVMLTSDFIKFIRNYIFIPFVEFCEGKGEHIISWSRFIVFFLLVVASVLLIKSSLYLFNASSANINDEKMYKENPTLVKNSFIFFNSISEMRFDDFKKDEVEFEDDLKSQIYINSIIAKIKFKNYNNGLRWFKFFLYVSGILFVAIMVMK